MFVLVLWPYIMNNYYELEDVQHKREYCTMFSAFKVIPNQVLILIFEMIEFKFKFKFLGPVYCNPWRMLLSLRRISPAVGTADLFFPHLP